jgi:hypothetical protein
VSLSRLELLKRATALVAGLSLGRLRWVEQAFAAGPNLVRQTMDALVGFVVPERKVRAAATPRLIRTLDRFLPGPLPLSTTAASILNGAAAQVKPGSTFAKLSSAEKARVFQTLESLPVESAGSIRFLVGNLSDLTAFLAYSSRAGWRAARYKGTAHGWKELKGYWQGRKAADAGA